MRSGCLAWQPWTCCTAGWVTTKGPDVNSYNHDGPAPGAGESTDGPITSSAAAERAVRDLRAAGQLAEAVRLVGQLGPYGVADGPDATTSLGAAVLEAYGDQLAATDRAAADAAYRDAAAEQRSFAAAATSGGEGVARMAEADRIDAKRHR
jgi:hypothetical protein